MLDDSRQLPMFPSSDPGRDLLFHVLKLQAEAVRVVTAMNQALLQNALEARRLPLSEPAEQEQKPKAPHRPQNKELRQWSSCRAFFQKWEAKVRRDHGLKPTDPLSLTMLATACGMSAKTIERIMEDTYHLRRDQWPPSTWPEHLPDTA